ncbi:MAG: PAS domain-containing protein [Leptolyngbyaceae cyanobacterium]
MQIYPFCDISDRHPAATDSPHYDSRLNLIIDAVPACISYIDAHLRYRFANATYEAWFQLDRHVIDGQYLWQVIGDAAYRKVKPYIDRVFDGEQVTYETVLPYAQGSRHIRGTLIPDFDRHDRVQGYHALIVDISTDKQAETALRRSQANLAKAQELAHIGSWEFDLATQTPLCSAEMLRLFGLNPNAPAPELSHLAQFFAPETWAQVKQTLQWAIATGDPQPVAGQIMRPTGERRYLEGTSEAIKNAQGDVVKLMGTVMDVTDRKQRQDQLRLLESVVLHANDAVLVTEADLVDLPGPRIVYANPAFTAMTGYTSAEIVGQTPRILQGPKTDRASLDRIRAALKTCQKIREELINYRKDGTEFWVEMELVPITIANEMGQQMPHFVAIQRDMTARKRIEQTLKEQAKLIDIATDAFLVRDLESRLQFWSRGGEQKNGWRSAEVVGSNVGTKKNPGEP